MGVYNTGENVTFSRGNLHWILVVRRWNCLFFPLYLLNWFPVEVTSVLLDWKCILQHRSLQSSQDYRVPLEKLTHEHSLTLGFFSGHLCSAFCSSALWFDSLMNAMEKKCIGFVQWTCFHCIWIKAHILFLFLILEILHYFCVSLLKWSNVTLTAVINTFVPQKWHFYCL